MATITYSSREEIEVHKFSPLTTIGVPLLAIFIQAYVSLHLTFLRLFDIPLIVTVFFAVSRRNQVAGLLTGCVIGLTQDALTHLPIGIYGISKTVVGYGASSIGVKIDVDNPGSRFLMMFLFTFVHEGIYFMVRRHLLFLAANFQFGHVLTAALANSVLAVALFSVMDRMKK